MATPALDSSQLSESQQLALATLTSVTNQEQSDAIPLLRRSEWNVQVLEPCHTRRTHEADCSPRLPLPNSSMVKPPTQLKKLVQLLRPLPHPPSLHTERLSSTACPPSQDQWAYLVGSQLRG